MSIIEHNFRPQINVRGKRLQLFLPLWTDGRNNSVTLNYFNHNTVQNRIMRSALNLIMVNKTHPLNLKRYKYLNDINTTIIIKRIICRIHDTGNSRTGFKHFRHQNMVRQRLFVYLILLRYLAYWQICTV